MSDVRRRLKDFLNAQANTRFAQIGHSDAMTSDAKREAWWWLQTRGQALSRRVGLVTGRAVVWTAPGRAELVPIEATRAGAGEVTVEVLASVVSAGTERAQYLRLPNALVDYPHRPGYSAAGIVILSPGNEFEAGELVALRNVQHSSVVTAPVRSVHRVPAGVSAEAAALVQLGVICGQGVRRAALEEGAPVCVIGAGLIGTLAQRLAIAAGAGPVTVIANSRAKERIALAGGAHRFLLAGDDAAEIAALAAPVVIEATGDPRVLELAVEAAGINGRVVLLGSPRGVTPNVPLDAIRTKRLRIVGAHISTLRAESAVEGVDMFAREAESFLDLLASGRLEVADLVEAGVDPREADAFYRRLAQARDLAGARFDWTLLAPEERSAKGRFWRLPNVSGRGTDLRRRPLSGNGSGRLRRAHAVPDEPFAEATGRLRIGLLGCGDIAILNATAIEQAPNVELAACYDPVRRLAEDIGKGHGVPAAATSEELVTRPDVDAVLLSVPHHLHSPLGAEAVAAGKHVIVEKPLANNLAAAVELAEAAERAGVTLSVCFPHRYEARAMAAKELIAAGALGTFAGALLTFFMDKPASYWIGGFSGRAQSNWRGSREHAGGGVLIMNLSHYIDLLRHLTGAEAELVSARGQTVEPTSEVEDGVSVTIQYQGGALGSLVASAAQRGSLPETQLRLWGSDGQIAVEPEARVYTLRVVNGLRTNRWQTFGSPRKRNARALYFSRLSTALDQGLSPDVGPADGIAVQAIIEAAYRSSESGSAVRPSDLLEVSV